MIPDEDEAKKKLLSLREAEEEKYESLYPNREPSEEELQPKEIEKTVQPVEFVKRHKDAEKKFKGPTQITDAAKKTPESFKKLAERKRLEKRRAGMREGMGGRRRDIWNDERFSGND